MMRRKRWNNTHTYVHMYIRTYGAASADTILCFHKRTHAIGHSLS